MIYFIRSGDAVKIGYADAPDRGIPTLRTANPNDIVVLGVMDGSLQDEKALHEKFAAHWLRREWFVLCDEIAKFIEAHARPYLLGARHIGAYPPDDVPRAPPHWLLWTMTTCLLLARIRQRGPLPRTQRSVTMSKKSASRRRAGGDRPPAKPRGTQNATNLQAILENRKAKPKLADLRARKQPAVTLPDTLKERDLDAVAKGSGSHAEADREADR